jgi:hypothetical protein
VSANHHYSRHYSKPDNRYNTRRYWNHRCNHRHGNGSWYYQHDAKYDNNNYSSGWYGEYGPWHPWRYNYPELASSTLIEVSSNGR